MFFAIVPTVPPTFAVQPNSAELSDTDLAQLLRDLERHFMSPVVLVSWDAAGGFRNFGPPIKEDQVINEDLVWREFELLGEPEIPF